MANILDYLRWRGDLPFRQVPPGEVDALVLSYLSYMLYEGIVEEALPGEGVRLADAAAALLARAERERNSMSYSIRDDARLLTLLRESERFGGVRLTGYVNRVDREAEKQFSAVTCLLEDGTALIAFRGTDDTVVGLSLIHIYLFMILSPPFGLWLCHVAGRTRMCRLCIIA